MSIIKGTNQIVAGFGGTKRCIGEVYFSQSNLATDNSGALPLFTGETIASANTIYPEFYNWVLAHTGLQCTAAEYEAALTTYGECAKYVIGGGSLRLPLIKNYIKAANPSEGIKNIEAGLPDHNHTVSGSSNWGSLSQTGNNVALVTQVTTSNASASNSIYGKSSTVTPASTTLYPWVVAYAAAIPASTAQAAQFQQALSGKADTNLGNITESGKEAAVSWGRNFVNTNQTIASGNGGIAGTYNLGFTDGKVRIGVFACAIGTNQNGFSSMAIKTDIVTGDCMVAGTNNGFGAQSTVTIPFVNSVSISFPNTGAGISIVSVSFVGYFE